MWAEYGEITGLKQEDSAAGSDFCSTVTLSCLAS